MLTFDVPRHLVLPLPPVPGSTEARAPSKDVRGGGRVKTGRHGKEQGGGGVGEGAGCLMP